MAKVEIIAICLSVSLLDYFKNFTPKKTHVTEFDFKGFKILHRRRAHQKRLVLTVRPNGTIVLSSNLSISLTHIKGFLNEQYGWLMRHISEMKELQHQLGSAPSFVEGERLHFLGQEKVLVFQREAERHRPMIALRGEQIHIHGPHWLFEDKMKIKKLLMLFFKRYAKNYLPGRLKYWQEKMAVSVTGLSIKSQKSVWGSCSSRGRINLNMRLLVFAPEFIDYVIIHELAHVPHPNHSHHFWNEVQKFDPDFKRHKKFIRDHQGWADFLGEI